MAKSSDRPEGLPFLATAGVLETYFSREGGLGGLAQRVSRALTWSDDADPAGPYEIRILDSFFSDSVSETTVADIFERSIEGTTTKFLLADPAGEFARARARSIEQEATKESMQGLRFICEAARSVLGKAGGPVISRQEVMNADSIGEVVALFERAVSQHDVQLRFYDIGPSGPLYFFRDILVAGRFSAGVSAVGLPWSVIVYDPHFNGDLFDRLTSEYEWIWAHSHQLGSSSELLSAEEKSLGAPRIFVSYCESDESVADDLAARFLEKGIKAYLFKHALEPGAIWTDSLRDELLETDELIVVISETAKSSSDWIRVELGAAWVNGVSITPATVGCKCDIVSGLLEKYQQVDIASDRGKQLLVDAIVSRYSVRMGNNAEHS